jgi:hypothetical protein
MKLAFDGLKIDSSELREFTYGFFANMCSMLGGEDFSQYLKFVVGLMLQTIQLKETEMKQKPEFLQKKDKTIKGDDYYEKKIKESDEKEEEYNEDEYDTESEDEDEDVYQEGSKNVRESIIDEKASAIEAIGLIAEVSQYNLYLT